MRLQVEKQRERLPTTRAKGEDEMNNTIKTLQHKENKLAGAPMLCLQPLLKRLLQCWSPSSAVFGDGLLGAHPDKHPAKLWAESMRSETEASRCFC